MSTQTKRIDGKACVSTALLCEYFGVSRQAVSAWEKRGCPKMARGYWCVADVLAWKGEQDGGSGEQKLEDLPLAQQKMYWETRYKEEQAENRKLKNAILRGDYLEKAEMEKELAAFFVAFKRAVLYLPRKAAVTAAGYLGNQRARSMEQDMMEVVTDALAQWSRGDLDPGLDSPGPGKPKAPGKNNRKPVGGRKPGAGRKKQQ